MKRGAGRIVLLLGLAAVAAHCDFLFNLNTLASGPDAGNGDSGITDAGSTDAGPGDGGTTTGCTPDGGPPLAVNGLSGCVAQGPDGGTVIFVVPLSWQASAATSRYSIQRKDTNGSNPYAEIAEVDGATTTYVDHVQCWNWDYDYIVIPSNGCGDGGSNPALDVYTRHLCDAGSIPSPGTLPACCGTSDGGC